MNEPLMFINNDVVIEQLKTSGWNKYIKIKNKNFQDWFEGLSPIEKVAWQVKFNEVQENENGTL